MKNHVEYSHDQGTVLEEINLLENGIKILKDLGHPKPGSTPINPYFLLNGLLCAVHNARWFFCVLFLCFFSVTINQCSKCH